MKTTSFMLACCLAAGSALAQYGWKNYSHPQSTRGTLSSAKRATHIVALPPGYINSVFFSYHRWQ